MSPDGPLIGATNGLWELPDGWTWARVSEVSEIIAGQSPPSETYNSTGVGLPFFQGKAEFGSLNPTPRKWCDRPSKIAEPGDVLISVRAPVGPTNLALEHCGIGRGLAAIRPGSATSADWLLHYFRFSEKRIAEKGTGTTFAAITAPILAAQEIPLAPVPEQRRIVTRIDDLFAEIAEGEAALERARQGLDTWRRALLKAAVTGELTGDWREAHCPTVTGADDTTVIRDASLGTVGPYAVPSGWIWTTIGQAGHVLLGRQRAPQHHNGPHMRPYLRVANVLEDRIDISNVKYMNFTPFEFDKYHLDSGDILLNEGQSADLVGRSAIYRGEIKDCCFQKTLLRFRAGKNLSPQYAQIVFLHYLHSKRFRRAAPVTTNMAHLTLERLLPIEFPLPPKDEQEVIVHRYHEARDTMDEIASAMSDRDRDALRQSILKAAFEGRLVPQDPADEPASELLACLRRDQPITRGSTRRRLRPPDDTQATLNL